MDKKTKRGRQEKIDDDGRAESIGGKQSIGRFREGPEWQRRKWKTIHVRIKLSKK